MLHKSDDLTGMGVQAAKWIIKTAFYFPAIYQISNTKAREMIDLGGFHQHIYLYLSHNCPHFEYSLKFQNRKQSYLINTTKLQHTDLWHCTFISCLRIKLLLSGGLSVCSININIPDNNQLSHLLTNTFSIF